MEGGKRKEVQGRQQQQEQDQQGIQENKQIDGSNPDQCLPWTEEIFAMARNHRRNPREELLYNSGGSIQKTLYSLSPEAMEDEICDLLL